VLCGAVGLERETRGQAAGLRTHILVGLGATLFTLVSAYGFEDVPGDQLDPTRISAQIVTGVGFLGAGAIIRHGITVRGLTTAATLWMVAAIGLAVGAGYYVGAIASTVVVVVSLVGLRRFRPYILSRLRSDRVLLELEMDPGARLDGVFAVLGRRGASVEGMESEHEEDVQIYRLDLRVPPEAELDEAIREIRGLPGVRSTEARGWGSPYGIAPR
jgi:putative Mg2+ transporter-C (MgtC) family protein